ncbi:MAG TPA: aminotransferase class V-fold PLP-dependent enzyme [Frankiaceae bacterium]|nr:aminotransferase class V-fold PLP-dependent enzyme [Frankiaceae bacterium]
MPRDREAALALDAADPLAPMRSRFTIADPDLIYLDGNSLGRLPANAPAALQTAVSRQWGEDLVRAWPDWIDEITRIGDVLAEGVLGAEPGEVLVGDSTTVNLFKLAAAAAAAARGADPSRTVIVTNAANFPTDRYVLGGVADLLGMQLRLIRAGEIADAVGSDTALLCLSHVEYDTGERRDLAAVTDLARGRGVRVLWDLSHSAGSVPVQLSAAGAELAVGCTYKYLNAGPGAPAYLYVRRDLQPLLQTPIRGWFGQQDQFGMQRDYAAAEGIRRFAAGTPPILGLPLVEIGARLIAEAGIKRLAAKSVALTEVIIELADAWLTPLGFGVATPRDPARRGAHVSLAHASALPICRALIEAAGVVPDYRAGTDGDGLIRLGPAPLYTRHVEVWDAMARLRDLVAAGQHQHFGAEPGRVT